MKKFLSIFIAVAMVLSFAGMFAFAPANMQVAKAATMTLTDYSNEVSADNPFSFYTSKPDYGVQGTSYTVTDSTYYVYKMGQTIHGYLDTAPTAPWTVELQTTAGTVVDSVSMNAGSADFSIGTGNVSTDGQYHVVALDSTGTVIAEIDTVFIEYNLTWKSNTLTQCDATQTISGWITRGNGQTVLVPVTVYVAYPDDTLAGYYKVTANSSGQFSISFPLNDQIGYFNVYISDGYDPANIDCDAIIYDSLTNIPSNLALTLSTYVSPTILYQDQSGQKFDVVLKDQDGNLVDINPTNPGTIPVNTGTAPSFSITYTDGTAASATVAEVSKGVYLVTLDTSSITQPDIRLKAMYEEYGTTVESSMLILSLRKKSIFNPYVYVDTAGNALPPYGSGPWFDKTVGRDVYAQLPCEIGTEFKLYVGYYAPVDQADPDNTSSNWAVNDAYYSVSGPVSGAETYGFGSNPDDTWQLVENAGKISVTINMSAWERANRDCAWGEDALSKAENACCHEYTKTFSVCQTESCNVDKIALENGDQTDDTTIQVGKSADLVLSINPNGAPADLQCGCNAKIVHIYMVDGDGNEVSDAFTVATNNPTAPTETVTDIWYNSPAASGTNIKELPITFGQTDPNLKIKDNCSTLTIYGFTPNYINDPDADCTFHLVVQVFGTRTTYDSCGNATITYPLIYEGVDPISITPEVKELSSKATITEGTLDPDEILAGTYPVIDLTNPGFTLTPHWSVLLNGDEVSSATVSETDTGYKVTFSCPLDDSGTLEIYGYAYDTDNACATKEEVKVDLQVVKPEFTVQLGLADGSTIDNDGIITEGIPENIYVTPTDPRGIHDFSKDSNWTLKAGSFFTGYGQIAYGYHDGIGNFDDCGIPSSIVCYSTPAGCTEPSPITVTAFANPNTKDDPTFNVYFVVDNCAFIEVGTFKVVPPTVKVDPETVPFTIPATATHVTFTVTDAHGHGAPGVEVTLGTSGFSSSAEGYGWSATVGTTGTNGEVDWAFVPPYSGSYTVGTSFSTDCTLPCGWSAPSGLATIEAKYQAPVKDTEAPTLTITAPKDGETVNTDMVTVEGTVTDNVGVTELYVGTQKVSFAPDGSFSATVQLSEGKNTIKVFAFDAAGNKAEKDLTVTYAPLKKTVITVQIGSDVMTVNGQVQQLDVAPVIHNGHTYLPLRAIAEALGAKVDWIAATKGITLTLGKHTVGLQIGNVSAVVDGNVVAIFPPYLQPYGDGTYAATMVPLRVIAEGLGAEVTWDPATRVVTITLVQQP